VFLQGWLVGCLFDIFSVAAVLLVLLCYVDTVLHLYRITVPTYRYLNKHEVFLVELFCVVLFILHVPLPLYWNRAYYAQDGVANQSHECILQEQTNK
jgi:hypothetical protein